MLNGKKKTTPDERRNLINREWGTNKEINLATKKSNWTYCAPDSNQFSINMKKKWEYKHQKSCNGCKKAIQLTDWEKFYGNFGFKEERKRKNQTGARGIAEKLVSIILGADDAEGITTVLAEPSRNSGIDGQGPTFISSDELVLHLLTIRVSASPALSWPGLSDEVRCVLTGTCIRLYPIKGIYLHIHPSNICNDIEILKFIEVNV